MIKRKVMSLVLALALLCGGIGVWGEGIPARASEELQEENLLEDDFGSEVEDWMAEAAEEEVVVDEPLTVDSLADADELPEEWLNILLLGTDVRNTKNYGRTDSMIVLSVNMTTKQAKLTSFMRDIWTSYPGRSKKGKLNAACVYGGPSLTMRTINEDFGLNLKYYVLVNLSGMADIIDQIGGLRLDVTEKERKALNKGLFDLSSMSGMEQLKESGEQVLLNGNQAVAFARIRKIDSDYKRTERQRTVLTTIAKRLQEESPLTLVGVVTKLLEYVETNLTMTQLMTLASVGLQLDMDSIEQLRIPADHTFDSGTYSGVWSIRLNFSKNKKLLRKFIYG